MLNRVKKNLIIMAITGTLCLALPCFAYDSTISFVNINNRAYYDVEIVITDNNNILVPFKQLATLFDIPFDELNEQGIKLLMFDLDSTVMPSKSGKFPSDVIESINYVVWNR